MRRFRLVCATLALAAAGSAGATAPDDFNALLDEAWEWRLVNFPMFASQLGDRRYNTEWTDSSIEAIERRQAETNAFLQRVYAIDRAALAETDQLNYELFRRSLQDAVDRFKYNGHLIPFYQRGGVQNLDSNTNSLRFTTVRDFDDWLARMGKIDVVIEQTIELAERGRKAGLVSPQVLMQRIPAQIQTQLVDDPEASPFYKVFAEMPSSITEADQERLRAEARDTIANTVLPAYRKLDKYNLTEKNDAPSH